MPGTGFRVEHFGMTMLSTHREAATAVAENPALSAVPPFVTGGTSMTEGVWESAEPSMTPVLVAEQGVASSISAPVSFPRNKTTRRWTRATRVVAATLRRMFPTPTARPRPARRHYPPRCGLLEHSLMAREMHRL